MNLSSGGTRIKQAENHPEKHPQQSSEGPLWFKCTWLGRSQRDKHRDRAKRTERRTRSQKPSHESPSADQGQVSGALSAASHQPFHPPVKTFLIKLYSL